MSGFASSLFLNLEGIATAVIALALFREQIGGRTWAALAVMTAAGVLLTLGPLGGASPLGAALIVLSMACWGLDNNLTNRIAGRDPPRPPCSRVWWRGASPSPRPRCWGSWGAWAGRSWRRCSWAR